MLTVPVKEDRPKARQSTAEAHSERCQILQAALWVPEETVLSTVFRLFLSTFPQKKTYKLKFSLKHELKTKTIPTKRATNTHTVTHWGIPDLRCHHCQPVSLDLTYIISMYDYTCLVSINLVPWQLKCHLPWDEMKLSLQIH